MPEAKKYRQQYGDPPVYHTEKEAKQSLDEFMVVVRQQGSTETKFHLILYGDTWQTWADSVKNLMPSDAPILYTATISE